mgnify:CR=1 FL=1
MNFLFGIRSDTSTRRLFERPVSGAGPDGALQGVLPENQIGEQREAIAKAVSKLPLRQGISCVVWVTVGVEKLSAGI